MRSRIPVNTSLSGQLRTRGFAPRRGGLYGTPYPHDVRLNNEWNLPVAVRVLGFARAMPELRQTLSDAMLTTGLNQKQVEEHPTFRALHQTFPSRARMDSQKAGWCTFSHYDRLGCYQRSNSGFGYFHGAERLVSIAHIRYVARIPSNMEYKRFHEWEHAVMCRTQLLDFWCANKESEEFLVQAIARRTLDHLEIVADAGRDAVYSAFDESETVPDVRLPTYAVFQWPHRDADLRSLAARSAATLSHITDLRTVYGFELEDHGATLNGVLIEAMSPNEEALIAQIAQEGVASLKPAPKPKAPIGVKHLLVEVTDKNLVHLPKQNIIGDSAYGFTGTPVRWRLLVDEGSRLFYVEPILGPHDDRDLEGFLTRAWTRKPGLIFEALPHTIEIPKALLPKWPEIPRFLADKGVEMLHPKGGLGLGVTVGRLWLRDSRHVTIDNGQVTVPHLLQWTVDHQVVIAGRGWHDTPSSKDVFTTSDRTLGYPGMEHYTGIFVDTKAFAAAVRRHDVEDVLRAGWPRPNSKTL